MGTRVDKEKCIDCGKCEDVCPSEVYSMDKGELEIILPDDCIFCNGCIPVCPTNALSWA